MPVHACLLALHTDRPVKMMYGREEGFFGHIHRHPARMRYEHHATRDGKLVSVRARILLDGGAYASRARRRSAPTRPRSPAGPTTCPTRASTPTSSTPTTRRAGRCAARACRPASPGPRWTARRRAGHGSGRLRRRDTMSTGSTLPTGTRVRARRRSRNCSRGSWRCRSRMPAAACRAGSRTSPAARAWCAGSATRWLQERVLLRGLRRLLDRARADLARGRRAAGRGPHGGRRGRPGARDRAGADRAHGAGVERVVVLPADTNVGTAGSSSASRQTMMTGGAVKIACEAVRRSWTAAGALAEKLATARSRRPANTTTGRPSRSTTTARATRP